MLELNQRPIGLQPIALPLSYSPFELLSSTRDSNPESPAPEADALSIRPVEQWLKPVDKNYKGQRKKKNKKKS